MANETISPFEGEGRTINADSAKILTLTYHGTFTALESEMKDKGERWTHSGLDGTWYVVSNKLTRGEDGEMGTLEVTCTDSSITSPSGDSLTAKFEQIEVDFAEVNQPIEMHPDFLSLVQVSNIDITMKAWLKFKASPLRLRLENKYLTDPDDPDSTVESVPQTIQDWCTLYNRGIETYMTYLPVVSRIREYDARPQSLGENIGTREDPPAGTVSEPGDYGDWLKTCDKATYSSTTGRWTRTEQWTCAAEWPTLLYGGAR